MPTRPMKFTRYCLTQWISKLHRSFEIYWVRQCLVNENFFGIKDLWTPKFTIKLKSNLCTGLVNIFPNFLPCMCTYQVPKQSLKLWQTCIRLLANELHLQKNKALLISVFVLCNLCVIHGMGFKLKDSSSNMVCERYMLVCILTHCGL